MSRPVTTTSLQQLVPPPAPIKPLSEEEWYSLLDTEEASLYAAHLVEQIILSGEQLHRQQNAERGKYDWAVEWGKNIMEEVLKWDQLSHHCPEGHTVTWDIQSEPVPPPIDSWARGALPRTSSDIAITTLREIGTPAANNISSSPIKSAGRPMVPRKTPHNIPKIAHNASLTTPVLVRAKPLKPISSSRDTSPRVRSSNNSPSPSRSPQRRITPKIAV